MNPRKECVLWGSLNIFAHFMRIGNFLKKKKKEFEKNGRGFAQSNAQDEPFSPCTLWNAAAPTSLTSLPEGFSRCASPGGFLLPWICAGCVRSAGPVFCGTMLLPHVILLSLAAWIALGLRFNLNNSHIEQKYGLYEISCMLQLSIAPPCCGSGLFQLIFFYF